MLTASEIRQTFLDFFEKKGHEIVPSAPIVVKNDPTLLFTNAGMNQFKDIILGNKQTEHHRKADTQKCLRVSGKHNDLEEVGRDHYHHTMFEMLGNWSFGDYFKKEAIAWAWELLTEVYKLPEEQLYVTVFGGDEGDGLPEDTDALNFWKEHIAADRILFGNKKDNFWEMGATGPCGPCSEIHIDCRPEEERKTKPGKALVNADHPEVIEIWNLVFMEFNRQQDGQLVPLPSKTVDTGMGLERLVRVLQKKNSNYDTDLFSPLIQEIATITGKTYTHGNGDKDIAFRVVADHIRAIGFAIADGQLPSNTGAGYVIRRILRRAVRYYLSFLDRKEALLSLLVPTLVTHFGKVFPQLKKQEDFVTKVIHEEEISFLRTLESGLKRIEDYFSGTKEKKIGGQAAFELYDTFGFPLDLTQLIAVERGFTVDEAGFQIEMQKQKERSRNATAIDTGDWIVLREQVNTEFVGYDHSQAEVRILRYRKVTKGKKEIYQIVLDKTPFYAEMGGQVGDIGTLKSANEEIRIIDTKKENDLTIHLATKIADNMEAGFVAEIDRQYRLETTYNHSATHLLHAALKQILGKHVNQKGSLVSPDILRFDVSHFAKITDEEIRETEDIVNQKIRENIPVVTREMPKEEALKSGAMALFGEKYGNRVRVVTIDPKFSIELCGGTHVQQTGMIGTFKIINESSVAAGVRRIEALTGNKAMTYIADKLAENKAIGNLIKGQEPVRSVEKLLEEKSLLEKEVEHLKAKQRATLAKSLAAAAEKINGVTFVGAQIDADSADEVKKMCFELRNHLQDFVICLTAEVNGKAVVSVLIEEQLAKEKHWNAGNWIKTDISPLIKGGGGGQATLATAGGKDISRLPEVPSTIRRLIA